MTEGGERRAVLRFVSWLVALVLLDVLLFVPGYVFNRHPTDFWPFFPREHPWGSYGPDLRSAVEYVKALVLRRANLDVFRVSAELVALVAVVVWAARTRLRVPARIVASVLYVALLVFCTYHQAFQSFFVRPPAVAEDVLLLPNLWHYLLAMGPLFFVGAPLAAGLVLLGLVWGAGLVFGRVQAWGQPSARASVIAGLGVVWCVGSLGWFGVERDDPVVQALSKYVARNLAASRAEAPGGEVDRRYDTFATTHLASRPSVYLLMIEAYGEVLATWDTVPAYRALLGRVQARLEAKGFASATVYSTAPVHSGRSWLSIATVHTGMHIDGPRAFDRLTQQRAAVPTLPRFFKQQGYATWSLQPGSSDRPGLLHDLYDYDLLVNQDALGYHGPKYGFGGAPDQYSLAFFQDEYLKSKDPAAPLFWFYMAVSTHYPWGPYVPPYVAEPRKWDRGAVEPAPPSPEWPELTDKARIASPLRRSYFDSVEYEWRCLTDLLEADPTKDLVVVVMGDHQPRLDEDPPNGVTLNTPVHVLSRDPAFIQDFLSLGAQPGLYAEPGVQVPLRHEGLFSLFVTRLLARYGEESSRQAVSYSPEGASLSGLNR